MSATRPRDATGGERLDRFARLALDCVHRPYPTHLVHLAESDAQIQPPQVLTPAFFGCFDWHSAVHGHWLLAVALDGAGSSAGPARAALDRSLTRANLEVERAYLAERPAFERLYGLASLLTLHVELTRVLPDHAARLAPLAELAAAHLTRWLPKLSHPVRSGVHAQTAFSLGLALDWARGLERPEAAVFEREARRLFSLERGYALHLEPSGEDFLSPALGAADLMARVLPADALAQWLDVALPDLAAVGFTPATVTDKTDGRLAHLDGLNLSRAWMLRAIARALPPADSRCAMLDDMAETHAAAGLREVSDAHYAGSHWLGTFAAYLLVGRARAPHVSNER